MEVPVSTSDINCLIAESFASLQEHRLDESSVRDDLQRLIERSQEVITRAPNECMLLIEILQRHIASPEIIQLALNAIWIMSKDIDNAISMGDASSLEIIAKSINENINHSDVATHGCHVIDNLFISDIGALNLESVEGCELILKVMREYPTNIEIAEYGCRATYNLSREHGYKVTKLGPLGGCEIVIPAMQAFPTNMVIAQYGCRVIQLCCDDSNHLANLGTLGTCEVVIHAMKTFPMNVVIAEFGCRTILGLRLDSNNRVKLQNLDTNIVVATVMNLHKSNQGVTIEGCRVLIYLDIIKDITLGSVVTCEAVVDALKGHLDDPIIVLPALEAIHTICNTNNITTLTSLGACEIVIEAMNKHVSDEGIASSGCEAISGLCSTNEENCITLGEKGGCDAVVTAILTHKTLYVAIHSFFAMLCLSKYKGNIEKFEALSGCCEVLLAAIVVHKTNRSVVTHGYEVITAWCTSECITKKICLLGGCEIVIDTLKAHKSDTFTLQHGVTAIYQLTSKNQENIDKVRSVGGKDLVVEIIKNRSYLIDIVEPGCVVVNRLIHMEKQVDMEYLECCEVLIQAMKAHGNNEVVIQHGVTAISKLAQDYDYAIKLGSVGACEIILTAMKKFPLHLEIQEYSHCAMTRLGACSENEARLRAVGFYDKRNVVVQASNENSHDVEGSDDKEEGKKKNSKGCCILS